MITDEAVDALVAAMGEPVKSEKAAQRLMGIMIYAQSSFQWDHDGQTIHAELLNVLHRAMSAPQFKWNEECKRAVEVLRERVKVAPRVACRADELLNDGWSLVVKTDASNTGAGACLLLVKCADARQVTEEVLADPSRVKLISTLSNVLSGDEKKWLTFEQESYGMYLALRKWGRFLMQATIDHPDRCLIGLFMDSSTAVSQWLNVTVPGNIDFCNAKALRFRSWADKVSFVRYMNMHLAWAPGGVNDWADLLSRIADKLAEAALERERSRIMMPMMRHSYRDGGAVQKERQEKPGEHFSFSEEEWAEVHRAYLADETRIHNVRMCDLYRVMCMGGDDVGPGITVKLRTWKEKRFMDVTPPGSSHPMLYTYTTRRQLRRHELGSGNDEKVLVLVIPAGVNVRITTGESPADSGSEESWKVIDLKRDVLLHKGKIS